MPISLFLTKHHSQADTSWVSEYNDKKYSCSVAEVTGIQKGLEAQGTVKISFDYLIKTVRIETPSIFRVLAATNNKDIYRYVDEKGGYKIFNAKTKLIEFKDTNTKKTLGSVKLTNCIGVDDLY